MKSRTTERFRAALARLPANVRQAAGRTFLRWREDPGQPSLCFKRAKGSEQPVYSIRIGIHWRALGVKRDDEVVWFWIGSHADYDQLLPEF